MIVRMNEWSRKVTLFTQNHTDIVKIKRSVIEDGNRRRFDETKGR